MQSQLNAPQPSSTVLQMCGRNRKCEGGRKNTHVATD